MNRRHLCLVLVILFALIAAAGCSQAGRGLTASGTIEGTEYEVTAQVAGTLTRLTVHRGDAVLAGQILGRIDDTTLRLQLD